MLAVSNKQRFECEMVYSWLDPGGNEVGRKN